MWPKRLLLWHLLHDVGCEGRLDSGRGWYVHPGQSISWIPGTQEALSCRRSGAPPRLLISWADSDSSLGLGLEGYTVFLKRDAGAYTKIGNLLNRWNANACSRGITPSRSTASTADRVCTSTA